LEAQDVLDPGTAPTIDGLVVVANQEQLVPVAGEQAQPSVLDGVSILELIHQDVGEALAVVVEDIPAVAQQFVGTQQQLGEVHRATALAGTLVFRVDLAHVAEVEVVTAVYMPGPQALILLLVDEALTLAWWPAGLVQIYGLEGAPDKAVLIVGIQNLELLG